MGGRGRPGARPLVLGIAAALAAAACGGAETPGDGAAEWALPTDSSGGYPLANLRWYQEGRPVEYGGQRWHPEGQPLYEPISRMSPVGRFEGMRLYAPRNVRPPYEELFFPIGEDMWQMVRPMGRSGTGSRVR